ncbi:1-deoxy-D-xylulose-5-phosphate synthase [Ruminococcus albus]|uniref:1-deoxy-D-xylulose-5-phosphate synthase n=1 Tax=Ruminococcus albus (strain ATCC 27210 / DSM 20455 / JCM 14654 / NCDO 2250 / 7) TaxID=697329 RepID=E6UAN5_RUMA7|nr:1-deoxy-D-xylulose-5-phosphate synthase [Ruminococcus albus]ADU22457.1 deoxyxylulose-5-phosphate synthase [Ruminococcus albus 7 = DSM 20455]
MADKKVDLYRLDLPADLKKLTTEQCNDLCRQIRTMLIKTVSKNGGHLASNLGTVELTVALHRVFDSPKDKIVWDVGHQAYTHKILTGRRDKFSTLRKEGGISGFCRPDESEHDAFISGHSSNSISAALGIAYANKLKGDHHHAIAVLGDGAMSGGLSFEGLNNAGKSDTNIIVILNYNEMSISRNVGSMAKYLSTLRTKSSYKKTKSAVEKVLDATPVVGQPVKYVVRSSKNAFKNMLLHSTMFDELGFEFIGPIDGHNIEELEAGLRAAKSLRKPVFIHVNTIKGKGYGPAEANPGEFHGVGSFEISTGNPDVVSADSFSTVMGKELCRLARSDKRICAITAAMKYGTGLQYFAKSFPDRFFDVGIAEEHAVTFCGGLASADMIPVFAVYSTFLQRSYDQLIHDLAIGGLHAVICVDRAGIVGSDGETHQGIFDISFLTAVPDITIYSPSNYDELRLCLKKAVFEDKGIVAVRYPRGKEPSGNLLDTVSTGTYITEHNSSVLLVSYGRIYSNVEKAASVLRSKNIDCDVMKLVKIFPLSDTVIDTLKQYDKVFFFEEAYSEGSISQKLSALCGNVEAFNIKSLVHHGEPDVLLDELGLSADKIARTIEERIGHEI